MRRTSLSAAKSRERSDSGNKSSNHHIIISAYQHISTSSHQHIITSAHHHISTSAHHHIIKSDFLTPQRPNRYEENLLGQPISTNQQIPHEADKHERSEIREANHHIIISAHQHISTSSHQHISTSDFPTPQRPNRYEENLLGQPISTNQQIPPEADKLERSEIPRAQRSVKQIIISSYQHISTSAHHHISTSAHPHIRLPHSPKT